MLPVPRRLKCWLRLVLICMPMPSGETPTPRDTRDRGFAEAPPERPTAGTAWAPSAPVRSGLTRLEDELDDWATSDEEAANMAARKRSVERFTKSGLQSRFTRISLGTFGILALGCG